MHVHIDIKCSWNKCDAPATKHVRFGNRTFGVQDILPAPDQNYTVLHRNLWDEHVGSISDQYLDVRVFEVGACPSCRR